MVGKCSVCNKSICETDGDTVEDDGWTDTFGNPVKKHFHRKCKDLLYESVLADDDPAVRVQSPVNKKSDN